MQEPAQIPDVLIEAVIGQAANLANCTITLTQGYD
jgi:hypothetical protein